MPPEAPASRGRGRGAGDHKHNTGDQSDKLAQGRVRAADGWGHAGPAAGACNRAARNIRRPTVDGSGDTEQLVTPGGAGFTGKGWHPVDGRSADRHGVQLGARSAVPNE